MSHKRPVVRLKPNADQSKIRHGFPWVYANELVLDRRTKQIPAGTICVLENSDRVGVAIVGFNPGSRIAARVLDFDVDADINGDWIAGRIQAALGLRSTLFDAPFYRLVHAEADQLPGVIIDRFGATAVLQPNAAWADVLKHEFAAALAQIDGIGHVFLNGTGRARGAERLDETRESLIGQSDENPIKVTMNGATYFADILGGQKTGLFYDQRPNHAFVQALCRDARVLDVFCHVGGFGLAALARGAAAVTFVDGSSDALDLVGNSLKYMEALSNTQCIKSDAFAYLADAQAANTSFDVVICDPPAFAPSKSALGAGLRAYEKLARMAARVVAPSGYLVLCSCSHAATVEKFTAACVRA